MDFSQALLEMKAGKKVSRPGMNEIILIVDTKGVKKVVMAEANGRTSTFSNVIPPSSGTESGSQSLLADDWYVVE